MPKVSISTTYNSGIRDILLLENYVDSCSGLESKYQYMICEVVMLRLFAILEHSIEDIALKIACGASYANGVSPNVLVRCTSLQDAGTKMLTNGRTTPLRFLQWTKVDLIKKTVKHVLNTADFFYVNLQNHSVVINEMRIIRNHVAHRSSSTYGDYRTEISRIYGANLKINIGPFLISTNRNAVPNIKRYITTIRTILNDAIKGV